MCVGYECSKELYDNLSNDISLVEFSETSLEEFERLSNEAKSDWNKDYEFERVYENSFNEVGRYVLFFDSVG